MSRELSRPGGGLAELLRSEMLPGCEEEVTARDSVSSELVGVVVVRDTLDAC